MPAGVVGTPTTTSGIADLLKIDWNRVHVEKAAERPREYTFFTNVGTLETPTDKALQVTGVDDITTPDKPEGTRFTKTTFKIGNSREISPKPFGNAIEHTFEGIRDDQTAYSRSLVGQQARAGRRREEISGFEPLNQAFNTAFAGFTPGESLCSTAHVGQDGVTRTNRPAVDIGFSILGLQTAIFHFHALTDESNAEMLLHPELVILHHQNLFLAREILGSPGKPFTADNEINSLVAEQLSWMIGHFLTATGPYFVMTGKNGHDLRLNWRDKPIFNTFNDPFSMNVISSHYQRHTTGYWNSWRGIWGTNP